MKPAALLAICVMALAACGAASAACQLATIAEWKLRPDHYMPVVDGAINGQKIGILLDTGAFATGISRTAAAKLGLPPAPVTSEHGRIDGLRSFGVEGERRSGAALISELRIGDAVRKDWLARVTPLGHLGGDVALLLGYEFFYQLDVELDLAHDAVRLFQPKDCERAWLAYWSKDALAVPLESGARLQLPVSVNGKSLVAELDTGSASTWLTLEAMAAIGLSESGMTRAGCFISREDGRETWLAALESFAIGEEAIRKPQIRVVDLWRKMSDQDTATLIRRNLPGLADVLLGVDFLRSHRVYIAHSQRKFYFSYTGGTVFPVRTRKPCSEL